MPIQFAADIAPNGARHSISGPETPPAAERTELQRRVRRLPHRAEAQHVPAQAARHREHRGDDRAARPRELAATVVPCGPDAQRFLDCGDAAFAHPHPGRPRIGGQAVDVVEREPGVGDGREAGVDGQRQRVDHQAAPERRATDAREHGAVFEAISAHRRARRRPFGFGDQFLGCVCPAGRFEQGQPHVLVRLEADLHRLAEVDCRRGRTRRCWSSGARSGRRRARPSRSHTAARSREATGAG